MQNFKNLIEKRTSLAVIGLGYVGMPLAIAFADHINVTGFDLNKEKISLYKSGIDPTNEVGNEKIQKTTINSQQTNSSCNMQAFISLLFQRL